MLLSGMSYSHGAARESDMRKRMIGQDETKTAQTEPDWLDLQSMVRVEMTSEDEAHPIEAALGSGSGWQAGEAGRQKLRLLFDEPQSIRLIRLAFEEPSERTQEFVLCWSPDGTTWHDIARQQYNFSSPDSTREQEDYRVELDGVTALELNIIPNISGGDARASLAEWRVA